MKSMQQRQKQLRRQLEVAGISDRRVLDAIETTRRDLFVPPALRHLAYDNTALPIAAGQTISQPYIVALMTQGLRLSGSEQILEVGTGSGYQAAILAQLSRCLVTIERVTSLSESAEAVLGELGYTSIEFRIGDGTLGCPERAPYDGIIVTAAAPDVPAPLYSQLKPGGRLVVPVGDECLQSLKVVEKQEQPLIREMCGCRFVKLIGAAGWPER